MAYYLDPKNDFIFKRVFGNHPDLLISFLNALMPFEPDRVVEEVEYLSNEMVPDNPARKFSVVDVRCKDNHGRHFIVEMQMEWSNFFPNRMLFNASRAYAWQLGGGENYALLNPVYALGILNESFDEKTQEFYHRFQLVNRENMAESIEGLEVILVELPKFKAGSWADRKMAVLWLRFLREAKGYMAAAPPEMLENELIKKALDVCEYGSLSPRELAAYDAHMDSIRKEKSSNLEHHGKGRQEKTVEVVLNCVQMEMSNENIAKAAGISPDEVAAILRKQGLVP
jgi:predicted transposase/invertase (TIGR01784 family)